MHFAALILNFVAMFITFAKEYNKSVKFYPGRERQGRKKKDKDKDIGDL